MSKNENSVKSQIGRDLAHHTITKLRSDGLYRHYRCQKPGEWNMGFDIVTWPGSLCYTGDMGDFLFQRTDDMIAFMRGSAMSYGYAAEKCVASGSKIKEYSADVFNGVLDFRVEEQPSVYIKAAELRDDGQYEDEHAAMTALYESELFDGGDMPDCTDYTYRFLWCLHAIKWFCDRVEE